MNTEDPSKKHLRVNLLLSKSHWSFREKVLRLLWLPFKYFLFLRGPKAFSRIRVWGLRLFGAKISKNVLVMHGVRVWCPWKLEIGANSAIGTDVEIYNFAQVRIGEHTVISQYAYICTASHDYQFIDMPLFFRPIDIGSQAWVAARAYIGPGVSVGEGSVVGANAVVTKDVPEWTIAVGNPAKAVRKRILKGESDGKYLECYK